MQTVTKEEFYSIEAIPAKALEVMRSTMVKGEYGEAWILCANTTYQTGVVGVHWVVFARLLSNPELLWWRSGADDRSDKMGEASIDTCRALWGKWISYGASLKAKSTRTMVFNTTL